MKKQVFIQAVSVLLVLLFVYAASSKLFDIGKFFFEINNQPFPNYLTPYLMAIILVTEFGLSILLVIPETRKAGLLGSSVVMGLFTLYVLLVLFKVFPYVPCSCGGFISQLSWKQHLFFNLIFMGISALAVKFYNDKDNTETIFRNTQLR